MNTDIIFWLYLAQFFLDWKSFRKTFKRRFKHAFYTEQIFFENRAVYEILWKM
jgi:hypothetical protein